MGGIGKGNPGTASSGESGDLLKINFGQGKGGGRQKGLGGCRAAECLEVWDGTKWTKRLYVEKAHNDWERLDRIMGMNEAEFAAEYAEDEESESGHEEEESENEDGDEEEDSEDGDGDEDDGEEGDGEAGEEDEQI